MDKLIDADKLIAWIKSKKTSNYWLIQPRELIEKIQSLQVQDDGWCYDMEKAPRDGRTIFVDGGTVHWVKEMNGWFSERSQRFLQWEPKAWRPLPTIPEVIK